MVDLSWAGSSRRGLIGGETMSAEDLEKYETEMELQLYREYRDVVGLFTHVVETERRFYLTNQVELNVRTADNGEVYFEVVMQDAWVWDMYRPARFVKNVKVVTFKDVNIEELAQSRLRDAGPQVRGTSRSADVVRWLSPWRCDAGDDAVPARAWCP